VDTHCHLDDAVFDHDLPAVLERAARSGVRRWINVGYTPDRWHSTLALVAEHPGMSCMLGVHPGHASAWTAASRDRLSDLLSTGIPVAIGEIGLDFFRGETNDVEQETAFREQLALARACDVPAVIHMRDAEDRVLDVLEAEPDLPRLLFHSFDGSRRLSRWIRDHDAVIGVGGLATRGKSRPLQEEIVSIGLGHIVLETDSPYLVPNGFKHRRNTPESIPHIAHFLAKVLDTSLETVARTTTTNAEGLFARLGEPVQEASTP
jgi:TatD DNase family protein